MTTFALLSAALLGLVTVDQDLTIDQDNMPTPGESYTVLGDATLTINAGIIGAIRLQDESSLVVNGGELRGQTYIQGDNDLRFVAGQHKHKITSTGGNASIYIGDGFRIGSEFNFTGGTQHFDIHSYDDTGVGMRIIANGSQTSANLYAEDLYYRTLDGHETTAGLFCWDGSCGLVAMRNVSWNLYDINERPDGDSDGDGDVDLEDLNAVRNNFGRTLYGYDLQEGDTVPMDGKIDLTDLNRVRNNFGASNPVPEPDGWLLGILGGVAIGFILGYCQRD